MAILRVLLISLLLTDALFAQWAIGPNAFVSTDHRGKDAWYGTAARIERSLDTRWRAISTIEYAIPQVANRDFTTGARPILEAGIPPNTRYQIRSVEQHFAFGLGVTQRTGKANRSQKKAFLHWGLLHAMLFEQRSWKGTITDLPTNQVQQNNGTIAGWSYAFAPMIGYRSAEGKGRWVGEARAVLVRRSDERHASWDIRYALSIGYLWRVGKA